MNSTRKVVAVLAVLALVLALGIALGWFRRPPVSPSPPPDTNQAASKPEPTNRPSLFTKAKRTTPRPEATVQTASTNPPLEQVSAVATNLITDWEEKIDEVLRSDAETSAMGRKLLELLPRFPEAGQVEAAQHIANLLEDADYEPLAKIVANPATSEEVMDILMADLLNRPNALKLPALLTVAKQSNHPKATDAKDLLELYLEEDFGADWAKWEAGVQEWLKQNPD